MGEKKQTGERRWRERKKGECRREGGKERKMKTEGEKKFSFNVSYARTSCEIACVFKIEHPV